MTRIGLAGLGLVLVVACGSSSTTNGGTGGTSSGGTGASSGTGGSATGGSGGTSASGGTGGSATGGAAGAGGSATGGTGGTSASGGAAGSGGGTANPKCTPLCSALVGANCSSGPTSAGCLLTCKALTSSSSCDTDANAYFDCAAATTIQCNAAGNPFAPGCGADYLKAIGCAVAASPNQAMVTPCNDYCDKVVAAKCANNGTHAECVTNCLWAGVTGTGCDTQWGAYLTCANSATFSCLLGYAVAQGCGPAFTTYTKCINNAGK